MTFFSKYKKKNPILTCPYLDKKRQFCQNYTFLWVQKVNRMPYFSDFSRKNICSHAHILSRLPLFKLTSRYGLLTILIEL